MATDITRQAGKGLQKQLLISSAVYDRGYEHIFGKRRKRKGKPATEAQLLVRNITLNF